MLFNSNTFIFLFLPITLIGFYYLTYRRKTTAAIAFLTLASLFFYGYWRPAYLPIILISILLNYAWGTAISSAKQVINRKVLLCIGVLANLSVLFYYKYANFFIDTVSTLSGLDYQVEKIVLPLAISFFTFQQIAYLFDSAKGETKGYNFLEYTLFVTFFPQLIAGPIVHHAEAVPQYRKYRWFVFSKTGFYIGLTIFVIGLFKKVVIADGIAIYSTPVFDLASQRSPISTVTAWLAAFSYTFQLYFDFSGYSDMAIGIARMFGIYLPLNFNSPYKSADVIEFWRRWHMTLSRFLKEYLYVPLGGNRKGGMRRYANLMITMVLGGIWHGAGWTFVMWGFLHGLYLMVNHAWRKLSPVRLPRAVALTLTFLSITTAWVFFRADSMASALHLLSAMFGVGGVALPEGLADHSLGDGFRSIREAYSHKYASIWVLSLMLLSFFAPNTQQLMRNYKPCIDSDRHVHEPQSVIRWYPGILSAIAIFILFLVTQYRMSGPAEFLYFNF